VTQDGANALHAIVTGQVQGVGYRFFVEGHAKSLGLTGWVRNRGDGSVEVVAEGEIGRLQQLLTHLQLGPRFSEVESVDATWPDATRAFRTFEIRS
jgi:acylphosphatase